MSSAVDTDRWFLCRAVRPNASVRLFCLPFAGCGASAFNTWSKVFPETVELHAIQLPGRESRCNEPALTDAYETAKAVADAIGPYLDRRWAVFGYSMGALIAFELIRELRRRGARMPEQLFVAARSAPQLPATHPPLAQLSREAFLEQVRYYYEPPQEAWDNPDLLEIIVPVLRADMRLCDRYVYHSEPLLACPIHAFAGQSDRSMPVATVQAWRAQTLGEFDLEVFNGGHFFINSALARVQEMVISRLERPME